MLHNTKRNTIRAITSALRRHNKLYNMHGLHVFVIYTNYDL